MIFTKKKKKPKKKERKKERKRRKERKKEKAQAGNDSSNIPTDFSRAREKPPPPRYAKVTYAVKAV